MKLKVLAVMLGVSASAACVAQSSQDNFTNLPVVKDVHQNMTEQSVREIAGDPASTFRRESRVGTCYNYVLSSEGAQTPYFVSFDATGIVDNKGFETCKEYDRSQGAISESGDSERAEGF